MIFYKNLIHNLHKPIRFQKIGQAENKLSTKKLSYEKYHFINHHPIQH